MSQSMDPCGHEPPQGAAQLHGVCLFCYRDRLEVLLLRGTKTRKDGVTVDDCDALIDKIRKASEKASPTALALVELERAAREVLASLFDQERFNAAMARLAECAANLDRARGGK